MSLSVQLTSRSSTGRWRNFTDDRDPVHQLVRATASPASQQQGLRGTLYPQSELGPITEVPLRSPRCCRAGSSMRLSECSPCGSTTSSCTSTTPLLFISSQPCFRRPLLDLRTMTTTSLLSASRLAQKLTLPRLAYTSIAAKMALATRTAVTDKALRKLCDGFHRECRSSPLPSSRTQQ